ncbi:MAG: transglycosylase [Hyphomicrobiales bacterium]|nr:MAG: transglycosylase [Hyphomicrobiales bacterium]
MDSAELYPLGFDELAGWHDDDHAAAFATFLLSAELFRDGGAPKTRALGINGEQLADIMRAALTNPQFTSDRSGARYFFETHFQPHIFSNNTEYSGRLTGYYEPQMKGYTKRCEGFSVPLLRRPDDLVELKSEPLPKDWPEGFRFARRTENGLVPYYDRSEIEGTDFTDGALAGQSLEIAWLPDRVDAFFAHIQGSTRIDLGNNRTIRVSYDGKSGHPYTAIGNVMRKRGCFEGGPITMQTIKHYLYANPCEQKDILQQNRSYIFFQIEQNLRDELGPRAAAGVQLTKDRSLAIDRTLHTFHTPIYVTQNAPDSRAQLMIAQDTGSAIIGPQRGDLFAGSGDDAGEIAGKMADSCRFSVLVPRQQGEFQS